MRTLCWGLLLVALAAAPAAAQTSATMSQPSASSAQGSGTGETRQGLPTFLGDTGLWFVPTAETLPAGRFSTSVYRANYDRRQGLTDVSQIGVTAAFGVSDRLELFTSWRLVRLDRDVRPVFLPDGSLGGVSHEYPYMRRGWSKTLGGPVYVGAKWNLISESRNDAMSLAIRPMVKFPSGATWASTNDWDGHIDLIASREFGDTFEMTGDIGGIFRGDSDEFRVSDGVKWGVGASFPSRSALRAIVEWDGEWVIKDHTVVIAPPYIAEDGSVAPRTSRIHDPTHVRAGVVWQAPAGFFVHGGATYSMGTGERTIGGTTFEHNAWGFDVRVGWHPGVKQYVPPPPPPPPAVAAAPPPPPPANRNPVFSGPVQCDPCVVETGKSSTLSTTATDPDGDQLTYRWSAPTGTFASPGDSKTVWTAPEQEGGVPVTVTADDGKGGRAINTLTVQVVKPAQKTFTFEDVHFDFDKYNLKPDALKILDEAVGTLQQNPDLKVTIEGHCDSIGTVEYNLALGERRANAVRDYLQSRGVTAARLSTVSFGEERPKADNRTAEGRAENRRAALVVKIQ